jgi:hypothetical protein
MRKPQTSISPWCVAIAPHLESECAMFLSTLELPEEIINAGVRVVRGAIE